MRDDVPGFLDAPALDRVDLAGHSLGGVVAYLLAEDHPQRVHRLVLEHVPGEQTTATRPEGKLTFDWETAPAVRRQIDTPDPEWREGVAEPARRVPRGRVVTIPAGHLIHRAEPRQSSPRPS